MIICRWETQKLFEGKCFLRVGWLVGWLLSRKNLDIDIDVEFLAWLASRQASHPCLILYLVPLYLVSASSNASIIGLCLESCATGGAPDSFRVGDARPLLPWKYSKVTQKGKFSLVQIAGEGGIFLTNEKDHQWTEMGD